jgi:two-component system, sensor histidine kinase and response regulator
VRKKLTRPPISITGESLDRELALSRVGGDIDLIKEIAQLFVEDYPRVLDELHQAVDNGDAQAVERTAHGLKGSVSTFGAHAAMEAALTLENLGRARQLDPVRQALNTLELALAALRPELESL